MNFNIESGALTLYPVGQINTANAEAIEREITALRNEHPHTALVLDCENVTLITSSGLRIVLRLAKVEKNLQIINVSSEIYDVFDMTGIAEIVPVRKAYRKLDITGCEVIGEGSNGIVYRYSEDTIVKVYKNNDALAEITRERELARTALIMGVNTAIPYDVVKVGDKYGSVFELLSAKSISSLIRDDAANRDRFIKIFADMLKEIHHTHVKPGLLPKVKETYLKYADFLKDHIDPDHVRKLHDLIDAVPDSDMMIHGDYHTNNVHYANNEAILIDMDTLATGDPIFEFASVFLAYKGFNELNPKDSSIFLKLEKDLCARIYDELLRQYFVGMDGTAIAKLDQRIRLLGYARLLRRTIRRCPEQTENIAMLKKKLIALIDSVDSLSIA